MRRNARILQGVMYSRGGGKGHVGIFDENAMPRTLYDVTKRPSEESVGYMLDSSTCQSR